MPLARPARRVLRAIPLLLVAALGAAPPSRAAAPVMAGAARVEIEIPNGTPLAGYGAFARRRLIPDILGWWPHAFWFKSHDGRDEAIAARALVLEHAGRRLAWIVADLIAVDRRLTAEVSAAVERALGGSTTVLLSASHTHSGPGAFVDSELMGFAAVDRPDPDVRARIVGAVVTAARQAHDRRAPALLGTGAIAVPDLTRSRLGAPIDPELIVMKLTTRDGRPIALVWNFAIHPTALGPRNLRLSGDLTGIASRRLEEATGVPALYVNGAVGDVSPRRHGRAAAREVGETLARAVQELAGRLEAHEPTAPVTLATRVELGAAALSLRNCLAGWLPRALAIPLGSAFPADATLSAVAVGDAAWVAIPGELQAALGLRIKESGRRRWPHVFVAGLTNDYLGYFVAHAEYERSTYVTCATLYGAEAGDRLAGAASALLRGLGGGDR